MAIFTPQAAVLAGKLSGSVRRERKALAVQFPFIDDNYVRRRLARVRKQIDILSNRMEELLEATDLDAQAVDRVASALDKLGKLEQVLAGRPGPGNRKPAPDRQNTRRLAPTLQPVVDDSPVPDPPKTGNP